MLDGIGTLKISILQDVLLAEGKIAVIGEKLEYGNIPVKVIDLEGQLLSPGYVDGHVHFIGAAGDEGYASKTPEIFMSHFMRGGVTTAVGCLGFGTGCESIEQLYVKAQTLRSEGLSTYIYTGSFKMPPPSITGSAASDIAMLPWVIGMKMAIADGCSWRPTPEEFARNACTAWLAGLQSGKSGVTHVHLGRSKTDNPFEFLFETSKNNDIPLEEFVPTHCNWNADLVNSAAEYAKKGGYVDYSTILNTARGSLTSIAAHKAVMTALDKGAPIDRLSFSTDGNVGMPVRDKDGTQTGLYVERVMSLHHEIKALIAKGMNVGEALSLATLNPACRIGVYPKKGVIKVGSDADLIVYDDNFEISRVFALGKVGFENGQPNLFSLFEKDILS
jgi:beta-aspartyl-dipeptidase (metallo-type)